MIGCIDTEGKLAISVCCKVAWIIGIFKGSEYHQNVFFKKYVGKYKLNFWPNHLIH